MGEWFKEGPFSKKQLAECNQKSATREEGLSSLEFPHPGAHLYSVLETLVMNRKGAKPLLSSPPAETMPSSIAQFYRTLSIQSAQFCSLVLMPVGTFSLSDPNALPHLSHLGICLESNTPVSNTQTVCCPGSCENTLILHWKYIHFGASKSWLLIPALPHNGHLALLI